MKITVNFKLLNKDFDQELADNFFEGQEADGNPKFQWEDEMSFTGDPVDFKILNHDFFKLNGVLPNGESFSFDIWDTTILRAFYKNGQITDLAVSKKLVKDLKRTTQNEVQLINVILKDGLPFVNPLNGVYILKKDFPQELFKFANEKNE
jgi:hypothetical protein